MDRKRYDTVIVGGGIAGLTAAAYLARAGQQVMLIERNKEFGGLVNTFSSEGFVFDAGVRALENAGIILPMLEDLGIDLEVVRSHVSVGVGQEVLHINDMKSVAEYQCFLIKLYPESETEIIRFIAEMRRIMKHLDVLYGVDNPVFKSPMRDIPYLFKQLLPWLPKFLLTLGKIYRMNIPVEGYLEQMISDPALRDILSQNFFKGTPTFFAMSYFSLYLDYFYPKGGVGRLADAVREKYEELGGNLKGQTSVVRVMAEEQYVVDNAGASYAYDNLIWAGDLKTLYTITDVVDLSSSVQENYEKAKIKMLKQKGGESVFSLFMKVDLPLDYFSAIAHGHFFYTPSKHGLGEIHRSDLRRLLDRGAELTKLEVFDWFNRFLKYNTFEISIPGLKDAQLVPEGKSGVVVSFLADYELFDVLKQRGWYDELRRYIEEGLVQVISQSIYPKLAQHIISMFSYTPLSMQKRTLSSEGAIVGWSFEREVPVLNKIHQSAKSVMTPLPHVYMAGQWAYSPAGVPMSILTGKLAADKILS